MNPVSSLSPYPSPVDTPNEINSDIMPIIVIALIACASLLSAPLICWCLSKIDDTKRLRQMAAVHPVHPDPAVSSRVGVGAARTMHRVGPRSPMVSSRFFPPALQVDIPAAALEQNQNQDQQVASPRSPGSSRRVTFEV